MSKDEKQYGLILPKKQQTTSKLSNVFGDDNLSEEEEGTDWVRKALKAESEKNKMKKQTKLNMKRALEEDPTIYQYDEVYDDMERTKKKAIKKEVQKPKYIRNLLECAERRKKEQEHRIERMVQKEREAEGNMFADKESFVTSAYRAKLEEFKKMEEEEARMDRLEAIGDVTKQQDMSGFYRHLYGQTVDNKGQSSDTAEEEHNIESQTQNEVTSSRNNIGKEKDTQSCKSNERIKDMKVKKSRQYRQRIVEGDSDSDFDVNDEQKDKNDDSSTENQTMIDIEEPQEKKQRQLKEEIRIEKTQPSMKPENSPDKNNDTNIIKDKEQTNSNNNIGEGESKENTTSNPVMSEKKKDRSSIWKKRTVGDVLEAALQRYYTRKAMRSSAG